MDLKGRSTLKVNDFIGKKFTLQRKKTREKTNVWEKDDGDTLENGRRRRLETL